MASHTDVIIIRITFTFLGPLVSDCLLPTIAFLAFLKIYSRLPILFWYEKLTKLIRLIITMHNG